MRNPTRWPVVSRTSSPASSVNSHPAPSCSIQLQTILEWTSPTEKDRANDPARHLSQSAARLGEPPSGHADAPGRDRNGGG